MDYSKQVEELILWFKLVDMWEKRADSEAFNPKKGEPLTAEEIALENRLQQADGVGPDVFPVDGDFQTDKN